MELEIINKLYLELSQITTARNAREIAMLDSLKLVREAICRCSGGGLREATDIIDDALAKVEE